MAIFKRKITANDNQVTSAAHLTLRQSIIPCLLVTILFFLWGFAYGLLDVLNSHFQAELNITASKASGLAAAYFGAYFLCPITISFRLSCHLHDWLNGSGYWLPPLLAFRG